MNKLTVLVVVIQNMFCFKTTELFNLLSVLIKTICMVLIISSYLLEPTNDKYLGTTIF